MVGTKRHFALVASQFNARYVQGLVNHATEELRALVPGVLLTFASGARALLKSRSSCAKSRCRKNRTRSSRIGVIMQGATSHAEHLSHSVTNALQQIAIEHGVPVINAVLEMENEEQARERCLEKKSIAASKRRAPPSRSPTS